MSQKKVKRIRKLAKETGALKPGANYQAVETKKMMYGTGQDGKPMAYPVTRVTLINLNKTEYRKMLKAYKNGELEI